MLEVKVLVNEGREEKVLRIVVNVIRTKGKHSREILPWEPFLVDYQSQNGLHSEDLISPRDFARYAVCVDWGVSL